MSRKPRLLDMYCGGGGASMGYHRAGFEVVGVDNKHQPEYPFEFILGDALTIDIDGFDAYHASPPCQFASKIAKQNRAIRPDTYHHPNLIEPTRERLISTVVGVHGHINYKGERLIRQAAMGIDWMNDYQLSQAIPPAYTEFIGKQIIEAVRYSIEVVNE